MGQVRRSGCLLGITIGRRADERLFLRVETIITTAQQLSKKLSLSINLQKSKRQN